MTCVRSVKEKISFISYTVLFISTTSQSLVPKFSRSPVPCFPIARSAMLTPRLLTPPNLSLPDCSLAPTHQVPGLLMSNLLPDFSIAPNNPVLVKLAHQSLAPFHPPSTLSSASPIQILTPALLFIFFCQATFQLDILWNIHLTFPQSSAEKTKGAVLTSPGAFAAAWSEASIYKNNHISASCAYFWMSLI